MHRTTFNEYLNLREARRTILMNELDEKKEKTPKEDSKAPGVASNITLGKENGFQPFVITDDPRNPSFPSNKNLAPIVRAFLEAPKIKVYNSMGKDGKPKPHTLPQKKLYMVGGSVRDHLKGQTPHDIDLVTDATPDEIRMILSDNGFTETDSEENKGKGKPRSSGRGSKIFYVKGRDKAGTDFVFGVKVNGQEFDLATFRKDSQGSDGRYPDQMSFSTHQDDAARRDLTINSLYLLLNNPDGPNAQVTDYHGGIHDLSSDNVRFVGNAEERLNEDLLRALRYVRFAARYGKGKVSEDIKHAIKKVAPNIRKSVSVERIQEEFSKGLTYEDVDPALYVKLYRDLGLLDVVFPGMKFKLDKPEDFPQDRDKAVVIASLLRGNPPEAVSRALAEGKWSNQDTKRVLFLHKILELHPHLEPDELDQYLHQYQSSGISPKAMESWWDANQKSDKGLIKSFIDYASGPRIRAFELGDDGQEKIHKNFSDLFDPENRRPLDGIHPTGMPFRNLIGQRKREMEHQAWKQLQGKF